MAVVNSSRFNFRESVNDILNNYMKEDVVDATLGAIDEVRKEAVRKLKAESPKRPGGGKYAKGWTSKKEQGRLRVGAVVYGKSGTYQLAHLLEHGHLKRNGERTKSITHIEPVEDWAVKEVFERMVHKLEYMP